ncbi:uncharacterized protein M421DRAFT_421138 [Didymella exigua CBS 183.55]|uniref:Uncharacterized protein n=1 Tax=Didymella exigua CBS 183.55 TaxID=1150837 RepID=A0A6A5RJY7_9PLEO|nr:uncharacterized protein M421DRAFT_421138 [Didymella exigua CBS 183.55]KAF1927939.1 hypothetical protein M421DRAFT_421138 [Didymella exigua CBS 183.55]
MLDLKTWLLFIFAVASNAPNGGLTTFQGIIIRGTGFSKLQTSLNSDAVRWGVNGGLLRSLLLRFQISQRTAAGHADMPRPFRRWNY